MTSLRIAVLGAGTMGRGIAHAAAVAGFDTALRDIDPKVLAAAEAAIRANLDKGVERGKLAGPEAESAWSRLEFTPQEEALALADLVIEAVPEDLELKRRVISGLSGIVSEGCVVATNTSALGVREIADAFRDPTRVVGMHFFNPAHIQPLVEVVRHEASAEDAVGRALQVVRAMGKTPILVNDSPGFASSRLGVAIGLEAMRMLEEGVASATDIDTAMKLGYRHPMGPLELTDLVGLDVRLAIAEHLHATLGDRFAPPMILKEMVAAGDLGRKSGKGFYDYEAKSP